MARVLRLGNLVGTSEKVRTCRVTVQSQPVRIAFFAVASFPKEEAHLGSFVPKYPTVETWAWARNGRWYAGRIWGRRSCGAMSTASTLHHRKDQLFSKLFHLEAR
jgi:hypothetical protein